MSACKQKGAPLLLQFSVSGVSTLSCNALTHTIKVRHQSSPERIIVHIGFSLNSGNALTHSIKVRHQSSPDRIIMHVGFGLFPQGTAVQTVLGSAGHTELCELLEMYKHPNLEGRQLFCQGICCSEFDAEKAWRLVLGMSTLHKLKSPTLDFEHLRLTH